MAYLKPLSRGRLPGGYDPIFTDRYKFQAPNNRTITITPAIARPETDYVAAGFRGVQINGGRDRPASLNRLNHAVLFHPDYLQNFVGGSKPLSAFTREECRGAVQAHWDVRNGYGVISSGAQEGRYGNDPWAQNADTCPNQYRWIEEKWAELAAANPGTVNGGPYDGIAIIDPGAYSEAELALAQSSPYEAHQFMLRHENEYCPYFRGELWRFKPTCVLNQYQRGSTNSWGRVAQTRLTIRIVQLARAFCGLDPEDIMLYVFLNKAEFTKYTTRHQRPLSPGTLISYDFTNYSVDFMLFLCFMVRKVRHLFCWEDTQQAQKGVAVVPETYVREDGFTLITTEGSSAPKAAPQVSPYNPNITYPCLHSPKAGEDMAGLAGLWYQKMWAHVQAIPVNARFRQPGGFFIEVTATYDYDRWKNKEPYVELAEDGNNYVIIVEDFFNNKKAKNTIEVPLSTGEIISVTYWTGTVNVFRGQK
jgi:hypothetical protein